MGTPDSFYQWGTSEPLGAPNFTKRFLDLSNRLKPLEALRITYEGVLTDVEERVLAQAETEISALRARLAAIVSLEWLTGHSATLVSLDANAPRSLFIDGDDADLFAPGPYAVAQLDGDPLTYAVLKTVAYDRTTGQLDVQVVTANGQSGVLGGWSIGALAGSTLAQMAMLAQGRAVLATTEADLATGIATIAADQAAAHADRLAADADATSTAADRAAILAAIQAGPVLQVVGRTGIVTAAQIKTALALVVGDVADAMSTGAVASAIAASAKVQAGRAFFFSMMG